MQDHSVATQERAQNLPLPPPTVKMDDLHTIKRELTQIKYKVDYLLESLERMEKDHSKKSGELSDALAGDRCKIFSGNDQNTRFPSTDKTSKAEPGEVSSLNSSTSSKKDECLKLDRESRELNDSEEEEEGDLLEDEDEVSGEPEKKSAVPLRDSRPFLCAGKEPQQGG